MSEETEERVMITRGMVGICHMQVCAVPDASDEEILEVCNRLNPSGTQGGWGSVVREVPTEGIWANPEMEPKPCAAHAGRTHFLVAC